MLDKHNMNKLNVDSKKMRRLYSLLFFLYFSTVAFSQGKLSKSDLIKLDFSILAANKKKLQLKDAELLPAYRQLISNANRLLNYQPVTVMDKTAMPPSGNKHDYMSIAPYWWPDATKANGLPYIRKDGEVNPEVNAYPDKEHLPKLCENVYLLALAYYFSDNEKYAAHASKLIQVWFLDDATKMNPNLNYGQAVKGVIEGRAEGLIDTRHFIYLIDAVNIIKNSSKWSASNQASLKQWFSEFLDWMQTSKIGKDELNANNNHGVWYDAQRLSMALFIDSTHLANSIVKNLAERLDHQMNVDGFFPLELERTTSLHYSVFLLNAFYIAAQLSEKTNMNLWNFQTNTGKSLSKAFTAIHPYITMQKKWTGKQIHEFNFQDAVPLLLRSSVKYNCEDCAPAIKTISRDNFEALLFHLL